jgi:hypothetical protein
MMESELLKLLASGSVTPFAIYGLVLLKRISDRLADLQRKHDILFLIVARTLPDDQRAELLERNMLRPDKSETDWIFRKKAA